MSAHGGGGNPIFKAIGLLLLVAFVVGGMVYFFTHFSAFSIVSTPVPPARELRPYEIIKSPSTDSTTPTLPPNPLKNTKWAWQFTEKSDGSRTTPTDAGQFIVSFSDDGKVGSTTDCNGLGGTYSVRGNSIHLGSFIGTQMYCEGSLETIYTSDLQSATTYAVFGNELRIILLRGRGVMIFSKR